YAAYALLWRCIIEARKGGARRFDFGGIPVDVTRKDDPMYGPYHFKKGFGGAPRQFVGAHDSVPNELAYRVYAVAEPAYTTAVLAEHPIDVRVPVVVVPEARAALADIAAEFFDHPTRKLKLTAVTGTDGKTTTVHLVSDVLEASGAKTGFSTTVDFKVADHEWKNETRQSTQEAVEVQEFFAELLVAGGTWGVLEATSHARALRKLRGTEMDAAFSTNLWPEHLDFHGTLQKYLEAKGELFAILTSSTDNGVPKTAVLNG